jgi:hypothetical protein
MRFMIFVRSAPGVETEHRPAANAAMAAFREELARAGVLLDAARLQPSRSGWCVHYGATGRRVLDGAFTDPEEPIAGYTLISVRSRAEALQWSRRCPNPLGDGREAVIEVRQLLEPDNLSIHPIRGTP